MAMEKERREILKKFEKLVDPYRITKGKGFRLKDIDPGDTGGFGSEQKPKAKELLAQGIRWMAEEQEKFYAARPPFDAASVPGDGRGGKGRNDPARHVGREPARVRGVHLQAAVHGGARPRLHVALP